MARKRRLTLHFVDGSKLTFGFPKQVAENQMASAVNAALAADKIALEAEGAMFIIPWNGVKYVQVTPAPEKLPPNVIQGASIK